MSSLHEIISKRWSPVIFSDKPVSKGDMTILLEAARWAPSSNNQQPWRFIAALREDTADFQRLFDCLADGNKHWVQHNVPVLMLTVAEVISSYKNRPNKYAFHDVGLAMGNLLSQATSMGIYAHQMGGFDVERARNELKIPERFEPCAMVALGYHGSGEGYPSDLVQREAGERRRNPLASSVFYGMWGEGF